MYMAWFIAHSDNASGFEGQVREWLFSSQYGLNIKGLSVEITQAITISSMQLTS